MNEIGPVQLIVWKFDDLRNTQGKALRELDAVRKKGVIRLLDLLFVHKQASGRVLSLEDSDLTKNEALDYGAALGGLLGAASGGEKGALKGAAAGLDAVAGNYYGLSIADVREVAAELEPDSAAALMLIEHTWARDLVGAINEAGGRAVCQGFLTRDALFMIGEELRVTREAQQAIEAADAAKGQAILDALTVVAEAEMVAHAAVTEAEEVLSAAEAIKAAAAAEAVQALIAAELIEEIAAEEALAALVAADMLTEAALAQVMETASQVDLYPLEPDGGGSSTT
jgi:uncharacterized membrane protein